MIKLLRKFPGWTGVLAWSIGVIAVTYACTARAQDITNHAIPVGGGPGFIGFRAAGPCTGGQTLVWSSAAVDPACSSAGAVIGPGSSTDNAIARWNGTTGTLLKNSGIIIDNSNNIIGGTTASSTLTFESTSGPGTTDSIIFKTGSQFTSWTMETTPGSNTYTPTTGSVPGLLVTRAGANNCATTGIFATPGIGPAPSAGQAFFCSDLADSTAGNVSNIFAVAWNSGTRFTAGVTGIGVAKPGALLTNVWGLQGTASLLAGATGVGQGANLECDSSSIGAICIAVTLKIGDSTLSGGSVPGNSYINMLADAGRQPANAIRFQATAIDSARTNFILGTEGGTAVNGIDLSLTAFTTTAFKSPGFNVDNLGNVNALNSGALTVFQTNGTVAGGVTTFIASTGVNATENNILILLPKAFTARNMRVNATTAPVGAQTYTITLRKNSADTTITCQITGAATTCNDLTHTVSYSSGDAIAMKVVTSATAVAAGFTVAFVN